MTPSHEVVSEQNNQAGVNLKLSEDKKAPVTMTAYQRSYRQFEIWKEKNKIKSDDISAVKKFLIDCRDGYPNGKAKTVETLNTKFKGISHTIKSVNPKASFPSRIEEFLA